MMMEETITGTLVAVGGGAKVETGDVTIIESLTLNLHFHISDNKPSTMGAIKESIQNALKGVSNGKRTETIMPDLYKRD